MVRKPKQKTDHYFSQTQETEIVLSKIPVNRIRRTKMVRCREETPRRTRKTIDKTPIRKMRILSPSATVEIGPSPHSTKYHAMLKCTQKNRVFSSIKRLNFTGE